MNRYMSAFIVPAFFCIVMQAHSFKEPSAKRDHGSVLYIDGQRYILGHPRSLEIPVVVLIPDIDYLCYRKTLHVKKPYACIMKDGELIVSGTFGFFEPNRLYVLKGTNEELDDVYARLSKTGRYAQGPDSPEPTDSFCW